MRLIKIAVCLLFILSFINLINAFVGISSDYYSGHPLVMAPGETKDIIFGELQNVRGERNITVKVELLKGGEIAKLTDENLEYFVPLGEKHVAINMEVSVPWNADENKEYKITVRLSEVNPILEGGMISIDTKTDSTLKVLVKGKSKGVGIIWIFFGVIFLIVLVIIILFLIKKRKVFVKNEDKDY